MFYCVLLGFSMISGFYWILLDSTGFYCVLLDFIEFYWVLLGFTGFYWVLLGFTGFYRVLQFSFELSQNLGKVPQKKTNEEIKIHRRAEKWELVTKRRPRRPFWFLFYFSSAALHNARAGKNVWPASFRFLSAKVPKQKEKQDPTPESSSAFWRLNIFRIA